MNLSFSKPLDTCRGTAYDYFAIGPSISHIKICDQRIALLSELFKVIILGIVEGVTEFLPISSTGHLIVVASFLDLSPDLRGTFEIFIQFGAVVAVIWFYRRDLWGQIRVLHRESSVQILWLNIVIASIPAAAAGFLLRDFITNILFSPLVVAVALIIGGIVFILIERPRPNTNLQYVTDITSITISQSLRIGIVQILALIPGVSRSGASIIGGMLFGLNREIATRFSFYLAIPVLGGATLVEFALFLLEGAFTPELLLYLIVGAIISGVVAAISIAWLLRYVSRHNFIPFGYYRIIVGVVILILLGLGILNQ